MTTCIKCGKEIPDGELFCAECGLNPGAAPSRPRPSAAAQPGRMQTPVRRPESPKSSEKQPQEPTGKQPAKKEKRPGRALTVCACIVAAVSLGLAIWQFSGLARQRRAIRLREDDLAEREKRLSTLETQIDDLTAELAAEEEKTAAQTQQIEELLTTVNSAESSASQSQYDLSEQQKELEKATDENAVLEEQVTALERENERLRADYDALYATVDAQSEKLRFVDSYVVFVEDDGTGNYHRYDCGKFLKKNFWAYSRKLAERQGYTPCAQCFGS